MRPTLVVMVKEPVAGRVKTRLGREIGMVPAAWWFRHQSRRTLRQLADPRWDIVLAVSPDRAGLESRVWPKHLPRIAQGSGDLGARMARVLRAIEGPVLVVGADIPALGRAHVRRAFMALAAHGAVLGPATDGGYWGIGLRHAPPRGFLRNVRWSTRYALVDTIATAPDQDWALVDMLADVDTAADLGHVNSP